MEKKKSILSKRKTDKKIEKLELMITVLQRGKAEKFMGFLKDFDVTVQTVVLGIGTASSEILSYLGLDETKKEVVLSFVKQDRIKDIYEFVSPYLQKKGKGISFTIPLNSMVGVTMYKYLTKQQKEV